jgi:hypothetical protein
MVRSKIYCVWEEGKWVGMSVKWAQPTGIYRWMWDEIYLFLDFLPQTIKMTRFWIETFIFEFKLKTWINQMLTTSCRLLTLVMVSTAFDTVTSPRLNRINSILIPLSCNFFSGSSSAKNSRVKRAEPWSNLMMGDRPRSIPGCAKWGQKCAEKTRVGL